MFADQDDPTPKARVIKASLLLQQKVGTGTIDEKKITKAERVLRENKFEFDSIAAPHLNDLHQALRMAEKNEQGLSDKEILQSFIVPIMNLKANAATFNYPAVTSITGMVLTFLEDVKKYDPKVWQAVDLLYKTIQVFLTQKITGDGGAEGKALRSGFEQMCEKLQIRLKE